MKPAAPEQFLPSAKPAPSSHSDVSPPPPNPGLLSARQPERSRKSINMICLEPTVVAHAGSSFPSLCWPYSLTLRPAGQPKASVPAVLKGIAFHWLTHTVQVLASKARHWQARPGLKSVCLPRQESPQGPRPILPAHHSVPRAQEYGKD